MKVQDGTVQIWIQEKVCLIPQKFFCEGLRVQLAAKLFCLKTFMVYSVHYVTQMAKFL